MQMSMCEFISIDNDYEKILVIHESLTLLDYQM